MAYASKSVEIKTVSPQFGKKRITLKQINSIVAYTFMIPAMLALILFVFLPIIFSFIISFFIMPEDITQLADHLVEYFTTFSNLNFQTLYGFFFDEGVGGIFIVREGQLLILVAFILLLVYIRIFYRRVSKRTPISRSLVAVLGIISGFIVVPLFLFILYYIFAFASNLGLSGFPIENYRIVLTKVQLDFVKILFNTVFWTFICTFFHIILGIFLAIILNQEFKGKGFFRGIFILPWAIPSFASTLIWKNFVFHYQGFIGSRTELIFHNLPFTITIGDVFLLLIVVIVIVIVIIFGIQLMDKIKTKSHFSTNLLKYILRLIVIALAFAFGLVLYSLIKPFIDSIQSQLFTYRIVEIPNTAIQSFWTTAEIDVFGRGFRMLTFTAIIINIWLGVPFMMVSFLAALQSIPQDLYEAAEIDGASGWQRFRSITLPLLKPTLFTVSLLGIVWTFNLFNVVYILAQNQNIPESTDYQIFVTFIYDLFNRQREYGQAAALSFIVFIILLVFSRAYQKIFNAEKIFIGEEEKIEPKKKTKKKRKKLVEQQVLEEIK